MSVITSTVNNALEVVKSKFDFSVDKFPLSGPDGMKTEWYGLFRSDLGTAVGNGSVSRRYVPHQTDDVLALVEASQQAFGGTVEVSCHFRDGHYVLIQPTVDYRKSIFGDKDNIWPRLLINASYCMKAFTASMGYFRDVCKNMHIVRSVESTCQTIRHTSGLRSKMDSLVATFSSLKGSWTDLVSAVERMERNRVSMVEFLDQIYGKPEEEGRSLTIHKNRTEEIFRRLQREQMVLGKPSIGSDFVVTGWEAFNAVQGYVQHTACRRANFNNGFDRMILSANDSAVKMAETLALSA